MAVAIVVAVRTRYLADLSAFLPSAPTAEQAVLLDQLKSGAASRLLLVGIEGGDAAQRAEASQRLASALRDTDLFASVANGDTAPYEDAGRFVFEHRYALSPAVDAERFSVAGLRDAIAESVSLLGTPAGALIKPILLRDPTGETLRIVEALTPAQAPRSEFGVWVSRTASRALLVMTTRADGADLDGQERALASIRQSFAMIAAVPAGGAASSAGSTAVPALRLVVSGTGSFGVASRDRIKAEVERLAIWGGAAMLALLWLAFASLRSLAVAALPVATGVLAGIACVSLGFGQVHGMTLGFGTTLIGEAVDYAIYYLVQTRAASRRDAAYAPSNLGPTGAPAATDTPAERWLHESWPTVRLGLLTSLVGFMALLFAGLPGLAQLGVFSMAGLAAAAATTRFVFPVLVPNGAPGAGWRQHLGRFMRRAATRLPRLRMAFVVVAAIAAVVLAVAPSPWRGELTDLSPIAPADLALDAELRRDVGAADAGTLVAVSATSEAGVLAAAEAVGQRLDALVAGGVLQGYASPARFLPSPATQRARLAALPDAATLTTRLQAATEGGPLPATRLSPFIGEVEAARKQAPFGRADLAGTPLATAVDTLLLEGNAGRPWRALLNLQVPEGRSLDTERVRQAIAGIAGAQVLSVKRELDALYQRYLSEAAWQAGLGALAVVVLLGIYLRRPRRLLGVLQPMIAATLVVLAGLTLSGTPLGILHLVGLLLTVAIGSNYALFFDHLREQGDADENTLASLLLANLTTVVSFGLLATSGIPVLRAIGETVAPGALLCLLFAAAFVASADAPGAHGKMPAR